jgi:hypothetical protein
MATKSDLPAYHEYVVPALRVFRAKGGSATIEEMEEGIAELMALGDDVLSVAAKG